MTITSRKIATAVQEQASGKVRYSLQDWLDAARSAEALSGDEQRLVQAVAVLIRDFHKRHSAAEVQ